VGKLIGTLDRRGIREHVADRVNIAAPGGGYILALAGGLPHDIPRENFQYYKEIVNELRKYSGVGPRL
jgi:hypothetical protein